MQERLLGGKPTAPVEQRIDGLGLGRVLDPRRMGAIVREHQQVPAELTGQQVRDRRVPLTTLPLRRIQRRNPADGLPEVEQAAQGPQRPLRLVEQALRLVDFRHVHVGDLAEFVQCVDGGTDAHQVVFGEQPAAPAKVGDDHRQRLAEQRVAAAQVVVEEGQRRAGREGVQPQRELGQLDRHRVLVGAVDDPLQDHPPHNVPVIELGLVDGPLSGARVLQDSGANLAHPDQDGRLVVPLGLQSIDERGRFCARLQHFVREVVDEGNEEVPAAHRRIADFQAQQRGREVVALEGVATRGNAAPLVAASFEGLDESGSAFTDQGLE